MTFGLTKGQKLRYVISHKLGQSKDLFVILGQCAFATLDVIAFPHFSKHFLIVLSVHQFILCLLCPYGNSYFEIFALSYWYRKCLMKFKKQKILDVFFIKRFLVIEQKTYFE